MPITVNGISCILADGVREMTDTIGTGTYSLRGARTIDGVTYRTVVSGIGNGNKSVFTVRLGAEWESFIGTVASGTPAQLTRDQILSSSNGNNAVNWGAGEKDLILNITAGVMHSLQSQIDTVPVNRAKPTVFTSNGTLTTDADTLFAWVRIVGAGGAGGGCPATGAAQHASGSGGGGGEYAEAFFTAAQLGASKTVTIGAGGTAVSGGNGNTGGTTNFGSGLLTAIGGAGGNNGVPTTTSIQAIGGDGGTGGAGGFLRVRGGRGGPGAVRNGAWETGNYGGPTVLGGIVDATTATSGQLYGVGGSGANSAQNEGPRAGGAGAAGVCIVIEYLHV